jgi:serine/threonine protein kinase/tetratricopeptide (TPR) repeat protein
MTSNESERDPVEALAAEFMERQRQGERPSIEEYTRRHPELAEEIRKLFPTIAALEGWKLDKAPLEPAAVAPKACATLSYLGDYRIIREIGRGGMGIVYEAAQESLGRHVAVKVLPQGPLLAAKQLRRFEREARTAARLHHTNIVPVFGVGEQDGLHYYVMQLIRGVGLDAVIGVMRRDTGNRRASARLREGDPAVQGEASGPFTPRQAAHALRSGTFPQANQDLPRDGKPRSSTASFTAAPAAAVAPPAGASHTEIHQKGPPTQDQTETADPPAQVVSVRSAPFARSYWHAVARLGRQVASALDYAHSQSILHRDIKPANLLLDATGTVWVADFGLAKVLEQDTVSTVGDVVGTLQYMAPEQFQGQYDARSDICSLGLTLYELLALQPAFQDSNPSRLIHRISQEEPPRLRGLNPAIPRDLETIVHKACTRDPARRYQSARDLHDDLERFLEDRPIQARRVGYVERLGRWCRRNPAVAGLTLLAVSLLVLVAAVATVGYVQTRAALDGETKERQRADEALYKEKLQRGRADDALDRETKALNGEKEQRQRAEATATVALEVLEQIFERLAPDRIVAASQLTVASADGEQVEVAMQPTLSPETAALLEKLLVFYDRLTAQGNKDSKVRRQAAKANRRVGDIQLLLGQTEHALDGYQRSAALYRELLQQFPDDAGLVTELAGVHNARGQAYRKDNQPGKAKEAHLAAIEVLTSPAVASAPPAQVRYELARTYFYLSKVALEPTHAPPPPGKPSGPPLWVAAKEAEQNLARAVGVLDGLLEEHPTVPAYRHLLALCYREKSSRGTGTPRFEIDWPERQKAIDLLEQLAKQFPHVPEYRFDLSQTLALMDVRGPPMFFLKSAVTDKNLQEALKLLRDLVAEHPNVPDYQLCKAQIHHRLADLQRQQKGQLPAAEKNLRQAVELQNTLAQRFPKVWFHQFMNVLFRDTLVDVLMDQKKWEDSRPLLDTSIKQMKKLLGQDKSMMFLNFALANNYTKLARTLRELHEPELAAQADQQAREIRLSLPKGPGGGKGFDKKPPGKGA